ncbi:vacuolar protein-like protein sorting vps16 [Eremomyces bilateralis CBS 781.70]|uniref:Probable vacuolar protein sorting-associated protein 16 homolog n=1 Tax=Eremomyces bilateralis CBS 781.70 TaxID=1392243 RepID=A0A6G1GC41_9PEZI|nr:vacuolar protein-like protein sorting vps16 [Eremomyces bilateralis CBS 781.70]KAF1815594.1 vacuolar protein-like protein sorting vps16 [Eremomyces bilateralis CBS 781.70]
MSASKPMSGWDKVGDRFYRKVQLYTAVFDTELELENYLVAGAPYSGALAFHRNENKLQTVRSGSTAKAAIDIYSCAGKLLRRINWDKGAIKGLGWSEDEKLIVVTEDGTVRVYYDFQGDFIPFNLAHGADEHGVISCRFWSTGFVALLGNNEFVTVSKYEEPRPKVLAAHPEGEIHCWTLIAPGDSLSRSVEVLFAIDRTVFVLDATEAEDRGLDRGPFRHLAVSPNGKFVALYTDDGKVWVVSSDFQNRFSEYDTRVKTLPKDLHWCGNNAVIVAWEDEVHLIGPNGASSKYYYDNWVQLVPDIDGIRLFTNDACEFIQRVPDSVEEVFRLGSTSPASVLLDAVEQLEQKSPKADDDIQMIRSNLDEAVDTCVKAAGHEYDVHWQKQLMKAASLGKSVLDLYNSDEFVEMCETLRVLNAVRFYEIGIPLSYEQYLRLTPERLIERLINRQEYLLALKLSDFLHLPTERIYVHWASQKVKVSLDSDDAICRIIVQKLNGKKGISFEEIAQAAYDEGRAKLATELLNYEPRAGKQVPLLLNMKEDVIALDKAVESGDPDLVYSVLLQLKKKLPLASFFRTINGRPVATALVQALAADQDKELLKDLFYQDDRRDDGCNLLFDEALAQKVLSARLEKLKLAAKLLQDSKENTFQAKCIDETQRLLKIQDAIEKDAGPGFTGLSVNETIFKLVRIGQLKRAQRVQSEFKVPEKSFWWIRLRALVSKRDWIELEEMAKVKRSPISWEPFYNEILAAGNTRTASLFIPKCTGLTVSDRIEMWLKCGLIVRAGEEALKAKDLGALHDLKSKAAGNTVGELDRMIAQLAPTKR